jgi:ATP-dependent DNA helicase RecG
MNRSIADTDNDVHCDDNPIGPDDVRDAMSDGRLKQCVQYLKGVGPERAELFARLGVQTVEDLLYLLPRDYQDLRRCTPIRNLTEQGVHAVHGRLEYVRGRTTRSGITLVEAVFADSSGYLTVLWFNRPTVADHFRLEAEYRLSGQARRMDGRWRMTNPKVVAADEADRDAYGAVIVPIYPTTEGLSPHMVRRAIDDALERFADACEEILSEPYRRQRSLVSLVEALRGVHRPKDPRDAIRGRTRLAYDELLILQTALALKRQSLDRLPASRVTVTPVTDERIRRRFPFALTDDQNQAVSALVRDLASGRPMYRLLQGDVGSGKTAVAIYAILAVIANGLQALLMAPTEVLARQHFRTFEKLLSGSRVRMALLTGSLGSAARNETLTRLADGSLDLVVGTHALLESDVAFARLGLVVIDEQHKFGVRHRARFQQAGGAPHQLVMTATPIPRSLAMTWFGDLDLSQLRHKPPGRKPTLTYVIPNSERLRAYALLARSARMGRQGLVVCPRIEHDLETRLASVESLLRELTGPPFVGLEIAALHGKQSDSQKVEVIRRFERRDLHLLVCTVVVEVGIDVPNASVVLVENAERFGIAQLHQIRGRVGRGTDRGVCLLLDASSEPGARERLEAVARMDDGFALAELDARLRGFGEPIGERQHGLVNLRVADPVRDSELLAAARKDAQQIVEADPSLVQPQWAALLRQVLDRYGRQLDLALVG